MGNKTHSHHPGEVNDNVFIPHMSVVFDVKLLNIVSDF
jgi:hypothetical protein